MVSFQASWPKIIVLFIHNSSNPYEHEFAASKPLPKLSKTVKKSEGADKDSSKVKACGWSKTIPRSPLKLNQSSPSIKASRITLYTLTVCSLSSISISIIHASWMNFGYIFVFMIRFVSFLMCLIELWVQISWDTIVRVWKLWIRVFQISHNWTKPMVLSYSEDLP